MKRLLLIIIMLCLGLVITLWDEAKAEEAPPFNWFSTGITTEIDAHYFLNKELSGKFGAGIAVEFAQLFDNTVGLRGELVIPDKPDDIAAPDKLGGVGATIKIHALINKLGGKTLIPDNIQVGVLALVDVTHGLDYKDIRNPYISLVIIGVKW